MAGILLDAYRYAPPLASALGNVYGTNSQNPTKTDTTGRGLVFKFGDSPASGDNVRAITKAKASSSDYDLIARIRCATPIFNYFCYGLCVSDGAKFVNFGVAGTAGNAPGLKVTRWNTLTSFNNDQLANYPINFGVEWFRIGVVASKPTDFYISENGTDWTKVFSEDQSGFLTYTEVGIVAFVNRNAGAEPVSGTEQLTQSILYFKDPDIDPGF